MTLGDRREREIDAWCAARGVVRDERYGADVVSVHVPVSGRKTKVAIHVTRESYRARVNEVLARANARVSP